VNRDPFLRAGLIVTVTGFAAGLYVLFGPWRALALAAVGVVGAAFVSIDYTAVEPEQPVAERPQRPRTDSDGKPADFERIHG
jgi:hypothetical protein